MKLTQVQKESIVRAIFQDVPVAKSEDIRAAIQKELVKAMSPACQKAFKSCPKALRTSSSFDLSYERDRLEFIVGDAPFSTVIEPWLAAREKYTKAKKELQLLINGMSTLKQLTEALPEFVSYFPVEGQPTKNLPAVANVVSEIVKLGWKAK